MRTIKELQNFYLKFYQDFSMASPGPVNDPDFLSFFWDFLEYLEKDDDPNSIRFDGVGSYGGRQFGCHDTSFISLELVIHDNGQLVVYRGNHDGFWVPLYLSTDDNMLVARVKDVMTKLMGLK